ncbi:MAG: efflux RND transporter periplasmic adaptor subunit [Bacteroidales bacterium]|nr:MAG: efflux RND transporter periplasmic adaptor subunit [Bacteroidales bacterium]
MKTILSISKHDVKIIGITLVIGLFLGWLFFHSSNERKKTTQITREHVHEEATTWTCSMHPQIKMDKPGKCPICAMDLIPLEDYSGSEGTISPDEIQMTDAAMKLADVKTMKVKRDYSYKEVYLLGKVKPDERNIAELTARFGGRIEKLFVNFTGQNMKKGGKLATVYSPDLVTAQKELLEAVEYKQSNPSFYKAARSKLKLWDLTDEQINGIEEKGEPRNYFDILSHISGTVTMRHVALGDYVKEGSALFQVIDLRKVWVMFEAYESDLPWLHVGDNVEFTIQSLPGKNFAGRVTYIDPFLNPKTRIANVRIEVNNPGLELKPEMFANGIVKPKLSGSRKDILIPKTAILWTGKRSIVYVKLANKEQPSFVYREIQLGPEAGEFYVVEAGLDEGEEIVVNGVFKIDAAAQLAGKQSMMNPGRGKISTGHDHDGKDMNGKTEQIKKASIEHVNFKVAGNCEMCKDRIEEAATKIDGVNNADWNIETKTIHVSFNISKVKLNDIHKALANAGHDTEEESAPDEIYNKLPECCQYNRNN